MCFLAHHARRPGDFFDGFAFHPQRGEKSRDLERRSFTGHDLIHHLNRFRFGKIENRMDRSDRARMAAGKGDEVLIGLFDRAEPVAQMRHRPLFEGDYRRHVGHENTPAAVNFLWPRQSKAISSRR